jgi:Flp pilus assembly CpaF family ATPase
VTDQPTDPTALPIFGGPNQRQDPHEPVRESPVGQIRQQRPGAHSLAGRIAAQPVARAGPPVAPVTAPSPNPAPPVLAQPPSGAMSPWPGKVTSAYVDTTAADVFPVVPQAPDPDITRVRPAARPAPAAAPAAKIDWHQVALFRAQASERLVERLGEDKGKDLDAERELGKQIIQTLLDDTVADRLHDGEQVWRTDEQDALAKAIFDALFGLGRLQSLVDDDSVENIIISGADNVWVEKIDGELVRKDPIADSDKELLDELAFIATRSETSARSFSTSSPRLHMRLDGGSRLAAAAWVTARPSVVIRRHRLRKVTLDDLVGREMLTPNQASFLRAAIRARKSIVVAGPQGAGKTTMVRALCGEIPRYEAIGTFETEFELHLHELTDVHDIVHAWEARPGSGEIGPDGRQAGEFGLDEALYDSFRFNLSRQIVGEVRGKEVWAMIKAMESGAGSISTTHAADGEAAIRKLVTCAMEAGSHVTRELATSKLAETVDLIVQINLETKPTDDAGTSWRRSRWISEIVHVAPGEVAKGYATTHVFRPRPQGGPAVPGTMPDELRELERFGFDLTSYLAENGRDEVVR